MVQRVVVELCDRARDGRRIRRRHGQVVEAPAVVHQVGAHDDQRAGLHQRTERGGERLAVPRVEPSDEQRHERDPGAHHLEPRQLDLHRVLAEEDGGIGAHERAARERVERRPVELEQAERRPVGRHGQHRRAAKGGEMARADDHRASPAGSGGCEGARSGRAGIVVGRVRDDDRDDTRTRRTVAQHGAHRRHQRVGRRRVPAAGEMRLLHVRHRSGRVAHR